MIEIKAPEDYDENQYLIFVAGSIEMGKSIDWQKEFAKALSDYDVTLLNPRRDDWDSSWEQTKDNPQFREQVEWELRGLDSADLIVLNIVPDTKSPISLMELGSHKDDNMIVCCPEGFYRKGNVDIICEWYNILEVEDFDELVETVKAVLNETMGE